MLLPIMLSPPCQKCNTNRCIFDTEVIFFNLENCRYSSKTVRCLPSAKVLLRLYTGTRDGIQTIIYENIDPYSCWLFGGSSMLLASVFGMRLTTKMGEKLS